MHHEQFCCILPPHSPHFYFIKLFQNKILLGLLMSFLRHANNCDRSTAKHIGLQLIKYFLQSPRIIMDTLVCELILTETCAPIDR